MLIHEIVDYCDKEYKNANTKYRCINCKHPSECSGSCKKCLAQVHFPEDYPNGKHDYDCINMINFYVCNYINKYSSEMLYLLRKSKKLKEIDKYNILSIGCGAAPDLMAFEKYVDETNPQKEISYLGIDKNTLWQDVHQKIQSYKSNIITKTAFEYTDVIEYFEYHSIHDINVIVFQYVISHFYNTNQIQYINDFFINIIKKVIANKFPFEPLIILINDANSCNRGRDFFLDLQKSLQEMGYHGAYKGFYFDYNIKHPKQRYGEMHSSNDVIFNLSDISLIEYDPWKVCSSAQLLIEIK